MSRKKQPEEHENLERWLVSYADFMTLLFATFVVLYALAQSDVSAFSGIEEALRRAFSQNIFDNQSALLDGERAVLQSTEGITNPIMLEYISPKYEQSSYEEIEEEINNMKQNGVSAEIDERGLVIKLDSGAIQYAPGTAEISEKSLVILDKIAKIIKEKFKIHYIEVEGHTDSDPITNNKVYPSNWELSSARASSVIRYLISKHEFNSKIFIASGLADTVPIVPNTSAPNKAKNRRVEIVVLKNKNKFLSKKDMDEILKEVQLNKKQQELKLKSQIKSQQEFNGGDKEILNNAIDIKSSYESEKQRLKNLDNGLVLPESTMK